MTTGVVIMVVVVIVAMAALGVRWDWWRSGRAFCTPIPRPYGFTLHTQPIASHT